MLYFCGLSVSDVTPTFSVRAVDEMDIFPIDADVAAAASVAVCRWTEELGTRVFIIDGFKVGLMSVTMDNTENTKLH